ncbi:MAG: tetratricopeptide repeat protein [Gammaproteobacteria bacterium]|nr:tetratricopeptide repeat protein [Gammaproteobacteria bacterium]
MQTLTRLLLLLPLTAAACLPAATHADPFSHRWCQLSTPRFELITDLTPRDAARLAERMEVFRITAESFIHGEGKEADLPLKVVVFRDRSDFSTTMNAPKFSGFMQPSLREGKLVIGPQEGNSLLHTTALHEYTHYLLRNRIDVSFPVWYDEGLASFLSTTNISARRVEIGTAPPYDMSSAIQSSSITLKKAVESTQVYDWEQQELHDFYTMAWGLVHFIELSHKGGFEDRRPQLHAYLRAVMPPFESTFDASYEELAADLIRYTRKRKLPTIRLPRPEVTLPAEPARCLEPEERDYQLATAMMERNPDGALAILETLHAAQPSDVRYLLGLSTASYELRRFSESKGYAEQAMAIDPQNPSVQIQFASTLVHGCILVRAAGCAEKWRAAVKLFRKAIRQDPQRFDAVLGLGLSYLHSGRAGDALNYLKIAYQKAPWAPHINFYLGESYRLVGDRRAAVHLTNARNWSTAEIWRRLADAALAELP